MLFSVKNQLFVFATLHHSPSGFASVANVAAIGQPKMAYPSVILFYKSLNEFDYFFCYLAANMYGYICLAGNKNVAAQ